MHFRFIQQGVVGGAGVLEDLFELHCAARVGDLLLHIDRALRGAADRVALNGIGRDHLGLGRGANELHVALLAIFLRIRQPHPHLRAGFDARGVGPEGEGERDAMAHGMDLDLASALGFLDNGPEVVG